MYVYVCVHVRIIYQKIVFECQKKSLLPELILESELQTENWNRKPQKTETRLIVNGFNIGEPCPFPSHS